MIAREQKPKGGVDIDAAVESAFSQGAVDIDAALAGAFPDEGLSFGQRAKAAGGAFVEGASAAGGAVLKGMGLMAEAIDPYFPESMRSKGGLKGAGEALETAGRGMASDARAKVAAEGGVSEFLNETVPGALGSSVPFMVGGGAVGLAARATGAGLAGAAATGTAAIGVQGVAAGASQGYDDAKAHGASDEEAWTSALLNGGVGATEAIPMGGIIGRLLKRMPRAAAEVVKTAALEAGEEATQEIVQQTVGNLTAKYWAGYDEDRKVFEGVLESGGAGAFTGALLSLVGGAGGMALNRKPAGASETSPTPEALQGAPRAAGESLRPRSATSDMAGQPAAFDPLSVTIQPQRPDAEPDEGTTAKLTMLDRRVNAQADKPVAEGQPAPERTTIRAVAPTTPEDQADTDFAADYGVKLTLVEGDKGPLSFPGMHTKGQVFVDATLASPMRRRMVLLHELTHELKSADDTEFSSLVDDATRIDPEGMADAQTGTAKDWEAATAGEQYTTEEAQEETMARRVETLGRWLDTHLAEPERFAKVLTADKTFFERFRDAVGRLLSRVGVKLESSQQKRIAALVEELGAPPTKDARSAVALVRRVSQALDVLRGRTIEQPPTDQTTTTGPPTETAQAPAAGAQEATAEPAEPNLAEKEAAPENRYVGIETDVELAGGTALPARYVAVEADDLVPSHDARAGFKLNPKGDRNERDYSDPTEGKPYRERVEEIAGKPKPHRVTSDTPSAIEGPPVTNENLVVLGGNARTMGMQLAYSRGGHEAQAYRDAMLAAAKKFGIDPAAMAGMRNPVIVRVVPKTHSGERGEMSRELNESPSTRKTATTEAVSRGSKVDEAAARRIGAVIGDDTLAEALGDHGRANQILAALVEAQAFQAGEIAAFTDASGKLTATGKDTIEQTLLGAVVPSIRTLAEVSPAVRQKIIRALPSLVRIKTAWPDFAGILTNSIDALTSLRRSGLGSVDELSRQASIVPEDWKADAEARIFAEALQTEKPISFAGKVATMADEIADAASGQGGLFATEKRTPKQAFKEQFGGKEADRQAQEKQAPAQSAEGAGPKVPGDSAQDIRKVDDGFRFAVRPPHVGNRGPSPQEIPPHTLRDKFITVAQQYLRRVETVRGAFKLDTDLVSAIERLPGRAKNRLTQFERRNLKPIKELLKQYEIEPWEAGRYVYALHAPDANALAAKRHPKKFGLQSNPGSGMSGAEAAAIKLSAESDPKRAAGFKSIASILRRVSDEKLKLLVENGLLDQETADQWRKDLGDHYVSLRGSEYDLHEAPFGGSSTSGVKGSESKRREGRLSRADYSEIIPNTLGAAADKIARGAYNEVANAVGDFAVELNRPDLMEIIVDANGLAKAVGKRKDGEELYSYKLKGHDVHILIHDVALARSIKRSGMETAGAALRAVRGAMAVYRNLQTTWNPDWFLANFPSDMGDALITIQREGKGFGRKVLRGIPHALKAAWNAEHDTGKRAGVWDKALAEAEEDGAMLGIAGILSPEEIAAKLASVDKTQPIVAVREYIEATSGAFEKGTRLAIYKAALDSGISRDQAGRIARETTTPFVRKGEWSTPLGLLYAFFNARVQGAALVIRAVKHPRVLKAVGVLMALEFTLSVLNRAMMGEDDDGIDRWDKVRRDKKQNFLILGIPGTEGGVMIRAPRAWKWAHQFAGGLADVLMGDYERSDFAKDMLVSVIDAFSPLDTQANLLQAVTPTVGKPAVQVSTNLDAFNRAISPEYPNDTRPDSEQTFSNTSPAAKEIAKAINWIFGGDEVTEGLVSVKPGTLEHYFNFVLGGTGGTVLRMADMPQKVLSGEFEANDIPIMRKVLSTADPRYAQRQFYDSIRSVEDLTGRVNKYEERGERDKAKELRESMPLEWRMRFWAESSSKNVKRWRDELDKLPEDSPRRETIQAKIDAAMAEYNAKVRERAKAG